MIHIKCDNMSNKFFFWFVVDTLLRLNFVAEKIVLYWLI